MITFTHVEWQIHSLDFSSDLSPDWISDLNGAAGSAVELRPGRRWAACLFLCGAVMNLGVRRCSRPPGSRTPCVWSTPARVSLSGRGALRWKLLFLVLIVSRERLHSAPGCWDLLTADNTSTRDTESQQAARRQKHEDEIQIWSQRLMRDHHTCRKPNYRITFRRVQNPLRGNVTDCKSAGPISNQELMTVTSPPGFNHFLICFFSFFSFKYLLS